jgi:hypothetical protein
MRRMIPHEAGLLSAQRRPLGSNGISRNELPPWTVFNLEFEPSNPDSDAFYLAAAIPRTQFLECATLAADLEIRLALSPRAKPHSAVFRLRSC